MRFREHDHRRNRLPGEPSAEESSDDNLESSRAMGEDAIRSAEAAIERALSGDSTQYNRESQQTGGQ